MVEIIGLASVRHVSSKLGRGPTEVLSITSFGETDSQAKKNIKKTVLESGLIEHGTTTDAKTRWLIYA